MGMLQLFTVPHGDTDSAIICEDKCPLSRKIKNIKKRKRKKKKRKVIYVVNSLMVDCKGHDIAGFLPYFVFPFSIYV